MNVLKAACGGMCASSMIFYPKIASTEQYLAVIGVLLAIGMLCYFVKDKRGEKL